VPRDIPDHSIRIRVSHGFVKSRDLAGRSSTLLGAI